MTTSEYTDVCQKILRDVRRQVSVALQSNLEQDFQATPDKPGRKALKFCVWGKSGGDFWNRDYSNYNIIYNPYKELSQDGCFQVRFMFFLNRKETGKGAFNQAVENILYPLAGQREFLLEKTTATPEIIFLYRSYRKPAFDVKLEKSIVEDLIWLIDQTFPHFDKLAQT